MLCMSYERGLLKHHAVNSITTGMARAVNPEIVDPWAAHGT